MYFLFLPTPTPRKISYYTVQYSVDCVELSIDCILKFIYKHK